MDDIEFKDRISNADAEISVVGSVILDIETLSDIGYLNTGDFYDQRCRAVWAAILQLRDSGKDIDILTICEQLKTNGTHENVGGVPYFLEVLNIVFSTAHVTSHAKIVREYSNKRQANTVADEMKKAILENKDLYPVISITQEKLTDILSSSGNTDYQTAKEVVKDSMKSVEDAYEGNKKYISTGFYDLDRITGGLRNGYFIILAARPSMGKTSLATAIAYNAAVKGNRVGIFSLETSNSDLGIRLISSIGSVNTQKLLQGDLNEFDFPKIYRGCEDLSKLPIFFFDVNNINVPTIKAKCAKINKSVGLDLVVIDYLQLLSTVNKSENRNQEVSTISRGLKIMAREMGVPILCLSQLNRKVEERSNKRPILSDLRDSGSLEQDADVVAFIYRPEVYKPGEEEKIAEVNIAKNRNGQIGTVKLIFEKEYTRFENLGYEE